MKLFVHFCSQSFNNCYVLGLDGKALIIDPGNMEGGIIKSIEDNSYTLSGVLITHSHMNHVHGLKTLARIYQTDIYCINPLIQDIRTIPVRGNETLSIGPFTIEVISAPGHSADSAIYKVDRMLFTGDSFSAGLVGQTASIYAAGSQMASLRGKILSLPGDYVVFPGHGPPTSLDAERHFNAGLHDFDQHKSQRSRFRVELE